jgi:hypothetical protein
MVNGQVVPGAAVQFTEFPDFLPPFVARTAIVAPDGRLWVERFRAANDSTPVFDVFDRTANRVLAITLPRRTRLVGFGTGSIYLVRIDNDGLQYLQRYRTPSS